MSTVLSRQRRCEFGVDPPLDKAAGEAEATSGLPLPAKRRELGGGTSGVEEACCFITVAHVGTTGIE